MTKLFCDRCGAEARNEEELSEVYVGRKWSVAVKHGEYCANCLPKLLAVLKEKV